MLGTAAALGYWLLMRNLSPQEPVAVAVGAPAAAPAPPAEQAAAGPVV
ncbi:hypothetical protein [Streptomyces sp. NPDC048565]